jgi:hypothetical protein
MAETVAEDLVGEIEFDPVEPAILLDMRFVAVGGDSDMLQRHRHLRRRNVAQFMKAREKLGVAGAKPTHTRQVRALRATGMRPFAKSSPADASMLPGASCV